MWRPLAYLEERLDQLAEKYDCIEERRGRGLMQGLVLDRPVASIITKALDNGLIIINAGEKILRFLPPLVITEKDVDDMIAISETCLV